MGSQYSYSVSSDTIFELFPSAGAAEAYRRIYYYHYVFGYEYPVWFILHFGKNGKTKTGRLWILVNEKTGLVEDYAFRQYGGHTVLGRFPFASRGETVTTR